VTEPLVFPGPDGEVTVTPAALERLVVQAAQSVHGARVRRPKRSVEVGHGDGRASVSLELAVEGGVPVPELARAVQKRVADAIEAGSGLAVERVDVSVEEIG
jgi:uncharacterized alkaline shock family protein YloU